MLHLPTTMAASDVSLRRFARTSGSQFHPPVVLRSKCASARQAINRVSQSRYLNPALPGAQPLRQAGVTRSRRGNTDFACATVFLLAVGHLLQNTSQVRGCIATIAPKNVAGR